MGYLSIGAEGYVGIALETTAGTYAAPTKFFPIRSESLSWSQNTNWRRVIRGTADVIGAIPGNGNVEGDIDMELLADVLPYFLRTARGTLSAITTPEAGYEFVPTHGALASATMSVTVVRSGEAFGYVGCNVSSMTFGVDNDMATSTFTVLGMREESVAVPAAPTYTDDEPYGSGQWVIEVPTGTQVFDCDGFSFEVDDGGEVQNRLKNVLGAQFVAFGERTVSMSVDRDFDNRTEYNQFKALTERTITVQAGSTATNNVRFTMPTGIIDDYSVNLSDVGSLVRASVTYQGTHDADTGGAYKIEVFTDESVPLAP
jgi:hypothetical protein